MPLYNSPFTAQPPQNPGGTKNTHWVLIRANGKTVGRIQSFAPRQTRETTRVFELNRFSTGKGVDIVPGVVATDELTVEGFELWVKSFEEAIGASDRPIEHLADQYAPFDIQEVWYQPDGSVKTRTYYGCFLREANPDPLRGDGDKVYKKTAVIEVLGRIDS